MKTHIIKLPKRNVSLTIDEQPDKILVNVDYEKTGQFGDNKEVTLWLESIFFEFENDKRPITFSGLVVGKTISFIGDYNTGIAFISDSK
jgi:hypothetical protein